VGAPVYSEVPVNPEPKPMPAPKPKEKPKETSAPATITLNVPADAKVTIDGVATTSTSTVRVYSTPALSVGAVYYYNFTAETVRDGKILSATQKVAVEAGLNANVTLTPAVVPTVAIK